MSEFSILGTAAAGMDAQRFALDVAARNVAAAQVSDPQHPFARLVPAFATSPEADRAVADDDVEGGGDVDAAGDADATDGGTDDAAPESYEAGDATIRAVGTRTQRGVDADAVTEMVAVLNAQRAYEADAGVFDTGKRLAERTIDLGRL